MSEPQDHATSGPSAQGAEQAGAPRPSVATSSSPPPLIASSLLPTPGELYPKQAQPRRLSPRIGKPDLLPSTSSSSSSSVIRSTTDPLPAFHLCTAELHQRVQEIEAGLRGAGKNLRERDDLILELKRKVGELQEQLGQLQEQQQQNQRLSFVSPHPTTHPSGDGRTEGPLQSSTDALSLSTPGQSSGTPPLHAQKFILSAQRPPSALGTSFNNPLEKDEGTERVEKHQRKSRGGKARKPDETELATEVLTPPSSHSHHHRHHKRKAEISRDLVMPHIEGAQQLRAGHRSSRKNTEGALSVSIPTTALEGDAESRTQPPSPPLSTFEHEDRMKELHTLLEDARQQLEERGSEVAEAPQLRAALRKERETNEQVQRRLREELELMQRSVGGVFELLKEVPHVREHLSRADLQDGDRVCLSSRRVPHLPFPPPGAKDKTERMVPMLGATGVESGVCVGATSATDTKNIWLSGRWLQQMEEFLFQSYQVGERTLGEDGVEQLHGKNSRQHYPSRPSASPTLSPASPRDVLEARKPQSDYWIPLDAFKVCQAFRDKHCPTLPMDHFYPFLLELNSVWAQRLKQKVGPLVQQRTAAEKKARQHATALKECHEVVEQLQRRVHEQDAREREREEEEVQRPFQSNKVSVVHSRPLRSYASVLSRIHGKAVERDGSSVVPCARLCSLVERFGASPVTPPLSARGSNRDRRNTGTKGKTPSVSPPPQRPEVQEAEDNGTEDYRLFRASLEALEAVRHTVGVDGSRGASSSCSAAAAVAQRYEEIVEALLRLITGDTRRGTRRSKRSSRQTKERRGTMREKTKKVSSSRRPSKHHAGCRHYSHSEEEMSSLSRSSLDLSSPSSATPPPAKRRDGTSAATFSSSDEEEMCRSLRKHHRDKREKNKPKNSPSRHTRTSAAPLPHQDVEDPSANPSVERLLCVVDHTCERVQEVGGVVEQRVTAATRDLKTFLSHLREFLAEQASRDHPDSDGSLWVPSSTSGNVSGREEGHSSVNASVGPCTPSGRRDHTVNASVSLTSGMESKYRVALLQVIESSLDYSEEVVVDVCTAANDLRLLTRRAVQEAMRSV